jgi:hypothetical protein
VSVIVCGKPAAAVHGDRIAFEQGSYRPVKGAPMSVPVWAWRESQ